MKLNESDGKEAHAVIVYQAKEVNAVIKPEGERNFQVFVRQDDAYLSPANRGADVRIDEQGRSYILVDHAKLYNLVRNAEYGEHTLKMMTRSNGFALYALSFVSCAVQEMISNN